MKIGYIQTRPIFGKKEENLKTIDRFLKIGAAEEADLLVLPELCNTGYVFRTEKEMQSLSESVPEGTTTRNLTRFAEDNHLYIVAGLCERRDHEFFNSAVLTGPDGYIDVYRKVHLFSDEKLWFSPGDKPFKVYEIAGARIGIMICFDWAFPEVVRILALKGAQIICHPANLILPYCQKTLLGAAIQNRLFIVTANRVGTEREMRFTGMSQIVSPNMEIPAKSTKNREEIRIVEIEPKIADSKKFGEHNDLWKDRRVEFYCPLLEL